ncbi:MAG: hypothetical protein AB1896_20145 [Thermodesulfobacteriota bacterium]
MRRAPFFLLTLALILPAPGGLAGDPALVGEFDQMKKEAQKETVEMFESFLKSMNQAQKAPDQVIPEIVPPADEVEVHSLAPVDIQPWQLDCPHGYDNGAYQGKSYCIKCPPNSAYRSTVGACVGCPPGYASDYARPGQYCFSCPPGYQAGYRQAEEGPGSENTCVKCPLGYRVDWTVRELTCIKVE